LSDLLGEWVAAGFISADQAHSIEEHEAAPHERRAAPMSALAPEVGPSLVVEALGYLGGVVMLVGAGILVGMYWQDLSVTLRLVLIGATAVALVGAGFAVPERLGEAAGRLRSVLWAAGVVATGAFLVVLCDDVLDRYDEHQLVIVGPGTAVVAAALWWLHRTWLQQLALFVPLMLAASGVGMELTSTDSPWGGAAMWGVAVAWAVLSWSGRLEPRVTGVAFGVLGGVLGAMSIGDVNDPTDTGVAWAGQVSVALALATAIAAVVLALWERSLPWLGVGALALLWATPRAADAWFPGRLSAALTFIITGGLLVGAAVWVARRRDSQSAPRS
jgi:hypothetical protein